MRALGFGWAGQSVESRGSPRLNRNGKGKRVWEGWWPCHQSQVLPVPPYVHIGMATAQGQTVSATTGVSFH